MAEVVFYYHTFVLGGLLVALASVIANVACFRGLRAASAPPADAPRVSILVPARNEARNIEACVRSLLAQDYPRCELLVLDDHSTDGTGDLARGLGLSEAGSIHRLLRGEELPAGWTGKNWACHQLSQQARGEFLFFTDADTAHAPGTVSAAVVHAERHRADLLSAWPRLVTSTWSEKLIVPMVLMLGMMIYPHWLVVFLQSQPWLAARLPAKWRRGLGAANGQFLFFRRDAYARIGGHAALRDHLVEDIALGRAVAERMGEGMRLINCDALRFSTCRMYRSFGEVWEGFTKNVRAAFENSLAGFLVIGCTQFIGLLLPFIFVLSSSSARGLVVWQIAVIFLIRAILTVRFRTSRLSAVLHPVGEALALAIGLNSWRRLATSGVSWKGRVYQAAPRT